jgi:CAAX protease family protein
VVEGVPAVRQIAYLVGIVLAIGVATGVGFQEAHAGKLSFLLIVGLPTVALAAIGIVRARYDGVLRPWMRVKSGDFTRGFAAAAGLFLAAFAFTKLVAPATSPRLLWYARLYEQIGPPGELREHVVFVVAAIILISIAEEFLWRGLVTSLLEETIGSRRAWVWAAVLYAVAHLPTAWALKDPIAGPNPLLPLAALVAGLLWGAMARRFERLLPGVFSHILFDWTVIMMFRLWGNGL